MANKLDFRVKNGLVVEQQAKISGLTYPSVDATSGFVITTDGAGVLTLASNAKSYLSLTDTPTSYAGQTNRVVKVKTDESGLDFGELYVGSQAREVFISNANQTVFPLTYQYSGQNSVLVFVNGVIQYPGDNFTISGTNLTFTAVPDTGSQVMILGITTITSTIVPGDGTVTAKKLAASAYTRDNFIGNGVLTTFNLTGDAGAQLAPFVYVGGVLQDPVTHYSINLLSTPQTITFTSVIPTNAEVTVVYGPVNVTGVPSDQSVTFAKLAASNFTYSSFTGNGSTTAFSLTQAVVLPQHIFVFVNSVPMIPATDYQVSGSTTLTFTTPPAASSKILVRYYGSPFSVGVPLDNSITIPKLNSDVLGLIQNAADSGVAMAIALG